MNCTQQRDYFKYSINIIIMLVVIFVETGPLYAVDDQKDFAPIFDGKTLDGWEGKPGFWRVENGAIVGQTTKDNPLPNNTFLIWRKGVVDDFELKLEYRIKEGNSGIQYRGWEDPENLGKWIVGGYQADIDSQPDRGWCGSLYEERGREFLARPGEKTLIDNDPKPRVVKQIGYPKEILSRLKRENWNQYHIIADGYHFIHKINGRGFVEVTDNDMSRRKRSGLLAFQLHMGPPMKLELRNIRIKICNKKKL